MCMRIVNIETMFTLVLCGLRRNMRVIWRKASLLDPCESFWYRGAREGALRGREVGS